MSNEIWKDIKGYEGIYLVSNLGNIKSLNYNNTGKSKLLRLCFDKYGYLQVGLCRNKKRKMCRVHRLVAIAFIDNPLKYPSINHIDEIKTNNKVENLEWCSVAYNNAYGGHQERINNARKGYKHSDETKQKIREKAIGRKASEETKIKMSRNHNKNSDIKRYKKVYQYNDKYELIKEYNSVKEVEEYGYSKSCVSKCCRGKEKHHQGYKWSYNKIDFRGRCKE